MADPTRSPSAANHAEPPLSLLLGLPFHHATMEDGLAEAERVLRSREPAYFITANMDFATQAAADPTLREIIFRADRVFCDGLPLVWLSRWIGRPLPERVAGSDMVPKLIALCARGGFSVYFLGSDEKTLEAAAGVLRERHPDIRIIGWHSPPYCKVQDWDNERIVAEIRQRKPDLLFVAFGCPKQERWIASQFAKTGASLAIGIGASLDFIAGKQTRAPVFWQRIGLEWCWRMLTDPRRLAKRYGKNILFFARYALAQISLHRRRTPARPPFSAQLPAHVHLIHLSESWSVPTPSKDLLLDLSQEEIASPALVAGCANLGRQAWRQGRRCLLWSPPDGLPALIKRFQLGRYLTVISSAGEWEAGEGEVLPTINAGKWLATLPTREPSALVSQLRSAVAEQSLAVDVCCSGGFLDFSLLHELHLFQTELRAQNLDLRLVNLGPAALASVRSLGFENLLSDGRIAGQR